MARRSEAIQVGTSGAGPAYRATVRYDGTEYAGFQIQPRERTIQGELERALKRITQSFVRVHGAGRTDAGVHAQGQVVSFCTEFSQGTRKLQRALNAVLPRDIAVADMAEADQHFHARFSAQSRLYIYTIYMDESRAPLLDRYAAHVGETLDVEAMREAASCLIGEQDFSAFGQPPSGSNTVRVVRRAEWRRHVRVGQGLAAEHAVCWHFEIEANAFLRGMVRRVVGTLLQVGRGRLGVEGFTKVLESKDISTAGAPAPAAGLCLWCVRYTPPMNGARTDLVS